MYRDKSNRFLVSLVLAIVLCNIAGCEDTELVNPEFVIVEGSQSAGLSEISNKWQPGDIVFRFDTGFTSVESTAGDDVVVRVQGMAGFDEFGDLLIGRIRFNRENTSGENEGVKAVLRADLTGGNHDLSTDAADLIGFNIHVRIDAAGDGEIVVPAGAIFPDISEAQLTIIPAVVTKRTRG